MGLEMARRGDNFPWRGGMKTHKRFLESGEAYPACGAEIVVGQGPAAMADRWAGVTCERCLRLRPNDTVKKSVKSFCWSVINLVVSAYFAAISVAEASDLGPAVVGTGFGAVVFALFSVGMLVDGCRSLRDWWREVERAETGRCFECSNPADSALCDKCDKKLQTPSEPRWAYLLDRDDVLVLDTQTTGLDADAEVTDVAVINTRGRVLLYDLRRAGATSYRDIHGPLMRVLDRASTVCVYNAGFDMQMIEQSAARHGLDATIGADVVCIMEEYANLYTDDGRWPKLGKAAAAEGVSVGGARHRPLTDARLTLDLMRAVVERERAHARRDKVEEKREVLLTEDDIPF